MAGGQAGGGKAEDDGVAGLHAYEDGPVVEGGAVQQAGYEGAGEEGIVAVFVCEWGEEVAAGEEGGGGAGEVDFVGGVG